jgi:hypothetical protein
MKYSNSLLVAASLLQSSLGAPMASSVWESSSMAVGTSSSAIPSSTPSSIFTLDEQLELATTQIERIEILVENGGNSSFVFDFNNPPAAAVINSSSGSIVSNVGSTFPALLGLDSSLIKFTLGPCGLIVPHFHPRGDEFILTVEGTIHTQFLTETGSTIVSNDVNTWQSTIFPKGSIHFEMNPTCEQATFIGAFNSNDPGTAVVAPNFYALDSTALEWATGGVLSPAELDTIRNSLPPTPIALVEACVAACSSNSTATNSTSS